MKILPLYAPLEVSSRDFLWKLLYFYESKLYTTLIIGHHPKVNKIASVVGGGVYLGKNTVKASHRLLTTRLSHSLSRSGCFLAHHDEEGGLLTQHISLASPIWELRHPLDCFPSQSCSVIWGSSALDSLSRSYPLHKARLLSLGSLRFDIYHKRFQTILNSIASIVGLSYCDYTLIFSNFSLATTHTLTSHVKSPDLPPIVDLQNLNKLHLNSLSDYSAFYGFLDYLSSIPSSTNFLLKPHPAEDPFIYELLSTILPNLSISPGSLFSSAPVLIASACDVICSRCTTLVESLLSQKPTMNIATPHNCYSFLNNATNSQDSTQGYSFRNFSEVDRRRLFSTLGPLIENLDTLSSFHELDRYLSKVSLREVSQSLLFCFSKLVSLAKTTPSPKFIPFSSKDNQLEPVLSLLGLKLQLMSADLLVISK
jgi:surface carbohydrate biosynthesis protein